MQIPGVDLAIVPERKITAYLLNPSHPVGRSKAVFFLRFGFLPSDWQRMSEALLAHARNNEVVATESTRFGTRYVVDGPLHAPDGTWLNIRAAWYISLGDTTPSFVTAHPLPRS